MFTRLDYELTMGFWRACGAVWAQMLGLGHARPERPAEIPQIPRASKEPKRPVPPFLRLVHELSPADPR